jgi:hypothetical protein
MLFSAAVEGSIDLRAADHGAGGRRALLVQLDRLLLNLMNILEQTEQESPVVEAQAIVERWLREHP